MMMMTMRILLYFFLFLSVMFLQLLLLLLKKCSVIRSILDVWVVYRNTWERMNSNLKWLPPLKYMAVLCECEEPFTWIANTSVLLHVFPSKCKEKNCFKCWWAHSRQRSGRLLADRVKGILMPSFIYASFFLEIPLSSFISPWDVIGMCVCFLNGCSWGVDDTIRVDGLPSHYHKITKSTKKERNQREMLSFVQIRELENV